MILEDETFRVFSYNSWELTPQSNKKIIVACDRCGKIREINKSKYRALCICCARKRENLSEETRRKMSDARKGIHLSKETRRKLSDANKGKTCSQETRKKIGAANKGEKNGNFKWGQIHRICLVCGRDFKTDYALIKRGDGKYCSRSCAAKARRHNTRPQKTGPELIFEDLCVKHNLPFRFVGDGTLWLGNANPDFVHKTLKVVCEVFGDYWHSPLINRNVRNTQTLEGRKKQLKEEGYKLIVLWESDLKREDAYAFVLSTLKKEKIF